MRISILLALLILLTLSCTRNKGPNSPTFPECNLSEEAATIKATSFYRANNLDWGQPLRIDYANGKYYLYFPTPQQEIPLLGYRGIWVDCKTSETMFVLRH